MRNLDVEALVEDNLGLVHHVINKHNFDRVLHPNWAADRDDLFQIGSMALFEAAQNFDPERGYKFSTLACSVIRGRILNYLKEQTRTKRKANNESLSLDFEIDQGQKGDKETSWFELIPLDYDLEGEVVINHIYEHLEEKDTQAIVPLLKAGYSQMEIGGMRGVSQPTVGRWVRNLRREAMELIV